MAGEEIIYASPPPVAFGSKARRRREQEHLAATTAQSSKVNCASSRPIGLLTPSGEQELDLPPARDRVGVTPPLSRVSAPVGRRAHTAHARRAMTTPPCRTTTPLGSNAA